MTARDAAERGESSARAPVLLVAYGTGPMSEAQLHLACRSANDVNGVVRVLHIVTRSRHVPLDVPLTPSEHDGIDALMERAEQIAASYGVQHAVEVVCARAVGAAIIAEAEEHAAHSIFIGLRDEKRRGTALLISATVRHVLQHAPCPVQIGYLPAGLPEHLTLADNGE